MRLEHPVGPRDVLLPLLVVFASLAMVGCASVTASPAAGYDPIDTPLAESPVSLRDSFESSAAETHEYWSDPSIFQDAQPIGVTVPDTGIVNAPSDPATGVYVPPTVRVPAAESANGYGDVSEAVPYDRSGLGAGTFGRLYMQFPSRNGTCSASVVNSRSESVVVTAAHCLVDLPEKETARSVIFVPADRDNGAVQPYGKWAATEYLMPQNFVDNATEKENGEIDGVGWATDFAFLVMERQGGRSIQQAVGGGQGIAFGVPVQALTQIGYPSADPYDGTEEYLCASTAWTQNEMGSYTHPCSMTPGCSGGGWLAFYDRALGAGYLVAVLSTVSLPGAPVSVNAGSPLGRTALELYRQAGGHAEGGTPGS